jgi:hypothetical protein
MVANQWIYGRSIYLAHLSADGLYDWAAKFAIWHKDAKQLAALTYSDMRDMLLRRSLIKSVTPHPVPSPLEPAKFSVF